MFAVDMGENLSLLSRLKKAKTSTIQNGGEVEWRLRPQHNYLQLLLGSLKSSSLDPPFSTHMPGNMWSFVKTGFPCPNPSGLC